MVAGLPVQTVDVELVIVAVGNGLTFTVPVASALSQYGTFTFLMKTLYAPATEVVNVEILPGFTAPSGTLQL